MAAKKFTGSLSLFSLLANVADVKSPVIHPASTTHPRMSEEELPACGIRPDTVRLSIGTGHIDDILADLESGFSAVRNGGARNCSAISGTTTSGFLAVRNGGSVTMIKRVILYRSGFRCKPPERSD